MGGWHKFKCGIHVLFIDCCTDNRVNIITKILCQCNFINLTIAHNLYTNYEEFDNSHRVHLGDDCCVDAVGVGNVPLKMLFKVSLPKIVLYKVLYYQNFAVTYFQ